MDVKTEYEEYLKNINLREEELAKLLGCSEKDIFNGDITKETFDKNIIPYRVVYGNVDLTDTDVSDLGDVEIIYGNLILGGYGKVPSNIEKIEKLKYVGGDLMASFSYLKSLGGLKYIGGHFEAEESGLSDLGDLTYIGGDALLRNNPLKSVGKLKFVGGELDADDTYISEDELASIVRNDAPRKSC